MFLWKWDLKVANNSEKMRNQMQVMLIFMLPKKLGGGGHIITVVSICPSSYLLNLAFIRN